MQRLARPISYRADIDGLRAVAVVSVMLFHLQFGCRGGYVGVDIFFVISGYLITKIIERDLEAHRFSILGFYQRRIRRIFPALFGVFLAVLILGVLYLLPNELLELGKSLTAASTFLSNVFFARKSGYFDSSSLGQPLLHTWTLSVEEQFYILWPWLLIALRNRVVSRWRFAIVLAALVGSLALSAIWAVSKPEAAFYLLPSRAWELALGAVLALAPVPGLLQRLPRHAGHVFSITGLAMVLFPVFSYSQLTPFPGIAALLPCCGAALIIAGGERGPSLGGRLLSVRPLVWVGLISYSLYLWHWPILVFGRIFGHGVLTPAQRIACFVLTFIVSWLSWRYVEVPFRSPRVIRGQPRAWVTSGLALTAIFTMAGFFFYRSSGLPQRSPEVAHWLMVQDNGREAMLADSPCFVMESALPPVNPCLLGTRNSTHGYIAVLWGDSNATHLAPALQQIGRKLGISFREVTRAGCAPVIGIRFVPAESYTRTCPQFNQNVLESVLANGQVRVVVMAARWIDLASGTAAAPLHGPKQSITTSRQLFITRLRQTVKILTDSGRQVILAGQVPEPDFDPITCFAHARFNHWDEAPCMSMPVGRRAVAEAEVNEAINAAVATLPSVRVFHPFNDLCGNQWCSLFADDQPLYLDQLHLSPLGAERVESTIQASLESLLPGLHDAEMVNASSLRPSTIHPSASGTRQR
ncbi:MAG TPA: acyltransferase family protein [Terracidiphilus sp.]|nr:acyltransferase family protein [Terracidiphilus sp.]